MQPKEKDDLKTDLRHDNMEFSASTDGDDRLDMDDENAEDDTISGEELDELDNENEKAMAAALKEVEKETENIPGEEDEDDYYDNADENEEDDDA